MYAPNPIGGQLMIGPFFRSELPEVLAPLYYADFLPPGEPGYEGQFFVALTEIRDQAGYEWFPTDDVGTTTANGVAQVRRALNGMAVAGLFTHEYYLEVIPPATWETILGNITGALAGYAPEYVTVDYAVQYARAMVTSNILSSLYEVGTGQLQTTLSGAADLATRFYVFTETGGVIQSAFVAVPAFAGSVQVNSLPGAPPPPTPTGPTPTPTASNTPSATRTATNTATRTNTATATASPTWTPTATATATPAGEITNTATHTATWTSTPMSSPTATWTNTPAATRETPITDNFRLYLPAVYSGGP
jgi:hypothetical protein